MRRFIFYTAVLPVLALGACKKEAANHADRALSASTIILPPSGTLPLIIESGDTVRLNGCGNTYFLDGKCYVKAGGVLVIQPGVTVRGVPKPTPAEASALIVCRGGRIFADGTAERPITFTSTVDSIGGWGGIVILGRAPVNKTDPFIEGIFLPAIPAGTDVQFGGTNANDSSGRFTYVRILNAGTLVSVDNELNSLTLGGVGSGTLIHHVYAGKCRDDAFEMFGGTVRLTHIIADSPNDDCFDFDFGYRGSIQFALAFVKPLNNVYNGDANGIESDNDGTGSGDQPQTRPVITNMTIIGGNCTAVSGALFGARWRRNTSQIMYNSIMMGYDTGVRIETDPANPLAAFKYNLVQGFATTFSSNRSPASLDISNTQYLGGCSNGQIALLNAFGTFGVTFDARPSVVSPAVSGANFSEIAVFGFTTTTYRGAFSPGAATALDWAAFAVDNTPCN